MTNCKNLQKVVFDIQNNINIKSIVARSKMYSEAEEYFNGVGILQVEEKDALNKKEGVLYITDDSAKARYARGKGMAVLIYVDEENKEQDFSGFRYFIEGFDDADEEYYERIYQREKRLPWVIAETERLIIREMSMKDKDALYALYADKSVTKYMEDLQQDSEEQQAHIADYIEKMYGLFEFGMWLVEKKDTGEIIGRVGFQNTETDNEVELGFLIVPKFQEQGYAYEACRAAIGYMKENFAYLDIIACCENGNDAARGLCRKLKFRQDEVNAHIFRD